MSRFRVRPVRSGLRLASTDVCLAVLFSLILPTATDSEMPLMKSTWSRFLSVPLAFLRSRNSHQQTPTIPNRPPTSTDTLCTYPSADYGMLCTCALSSPVPSWILQPRVYFRCVSIPGVMILNISKLAMAILHAKACFRARTRDSEAQS